MKQHTLHLRKASPSAVESAYVSPVFLTWRQSLIPAVLFLLSVGLLALNLYASPFRVSASSGGWHASVWNVLQADGADRIEAVTGLLAFVSASGQ